MSNLDKNSVYYLGDLTNEQYDTITKGFDIRNKKRSKYLVFEHSLGWCLGEVHEDIETINALTLFY